MIERVAEAILKRLISEGEYLKDLGDGLIKYDGCIYLSEVAKAAIEALRDPTEAMLQADPRRDFVLSQESWEAMVDAALKETTNV